MADAAPRTISRRPRRLLKATIAVALLAATAAVVLTRPSVLAAIILPAASRAVGGTVEARSVRLERLDELVIEGLKVRAPGWHGPASEIASADRLAVRFSLGSLLLGSIEARSITVGQLDLRLAERFDAPGQFSLLALQPERSEAPATPGPGLFPQITIEELVVENGVVFNAQYEKLGELRFRGTLAGGLDGPDSMAFRLSGRPDGDGHVAISAIEGRYDAATRALSVEIDELEVAKGSLAVAPIALRAWAQQLGLEGRVKKARLDYSPGTEPAAELDVEGVAMDLPIEALGGAKLTEQWAGLADGRLVEVRSPPRMTVESGLLQLTGDQVQLKHLQGTLGARDPQAGVLSVPFECTFTLDIPTEELPPFDWERRDEWFAQAARIAPFLLEFRIAGFQSPPSDEGAAKSLQLPRAAARVLSDFNITAWTLDIESRFERASTGVARTRPAAGTAPVAAPIVSSGTLRLRNGSAAFKDFRYRLDDVNATISFRDDNVVVERLTGRGADNAAVLIEGKLDGIATGALIDLQITCPDAPIDERLFASFDPGPRDALQLLFDARAADALREAALLPDESLLVTQRQELARLGDGESVETARARLARSIEAGPFRLGGRCSLDLRIYSPAGFDQPVIVTGEVGVRDAGLCFGRFPYPLRLRQGSFSVLDEAIVIGGAGLKATTPAGGEITISGSVRIPRDGKGGRLLKPLVEISDRNDALNPALLAAIPFESGKAPADWPGKSLAPTGELLEAMGLAGNLELNGMLTTRDDGREDFRVRLAFADGTAAPTERGRTWLAQNGLPWPPEFVLEDCSARLDLTPERVEIEQGTGRRGGGTVVVRGSASLDGPDRQVRIDFHDLPIDRSFEGYLAADPSDAARKFSNLGPSGAIRGFIERKVDARGSRTTGALEPRFIEITLEGTRVRADALGGRIVVDEDDLRAESLEFRLSAGSEDEGLLRISGPLARNAGSAERPFEVSLANGRFESSLVRSAIADRAPAAAALLNTLQARGAFEARYLRDAGERFELRPRSLSIGPRNDSLDLVFPETDDVDDVVTADERHVTVVAKPKIAGGARGALDLDLEVAIDAKVDPRAANSPKATVLDAKLSIEAEALTPALRRHLPPPLDTAANSVDLASEGRFTLRIDTAHAEWPTETSATDASQEPAMAGDRRETTPSVFSLHGSLGAERASFEAGERFTSANFSMPFEFEYRPRTADAIDFRADLDLETADVFGSTVRRAEARLATASGGESLSIDGAGDLLGGRFEADASIDFKGRRYDLRLRAVDVDYEQLRDRAAPPGRGRIAGEVRFGGPSGGTPDDVAARRGTGRVAVRNATLASMPIALRVLQLTQFLPPTTSALTESDAEFAIRGNTAECSHFALSSGSLALEGSGTIDIPTFGMAMRLYPRGKVPLFSDIVGGLSNQLFAVDVRGTLAKPETSVAPIPAMTERPTLPPDPPPAPAAPQQASGSEGSASDASASAGSGPEAGTAEPEARIPRKR